MSLQSSLNKVLPEGHSFELLHLQSNPCEIVPIITPTRKYLKGTTKRSHTVKVHHFFALANKNKFVLALEIFVYITLTNAVTGETNEASTSAERLIFVSKADTNGYCETAFSVKEVTKTILEYLIDIDPNYYLANVKPLERKYNKADQRIFIIGNSGLQYNLRKLSRRILDKNQLKLDKKRYFLNLTFPGEFETKISLFTRPAEHYLFSGSSKNKNKHVLNGIQLMEWWLDIVDRIVDEKFDESRDIGAYLRIPGEDHTTVSKHLINRRYKKWRSGDIFSDDSNALAAFHIPLFPDDPKSRFLHQLTEENRILTTPLKSFWFELQERQEFKLSVLVSVIGVEGYPNRVSSTCPLHNKDVFVAASLKRFSYIKNYITADEFDSEEGALESYSNILDYISTKTDYKLMSLVGTRPYPLNSLRSQSVSRPQELMITVLQPRKKMKK